jgi:uncharacterized membrane protein
MEMNLWSIILFVVVLVYLAVVLFIRVGFNTREGERRLKDRRASSMHMPIERRRSPMDRREVSRRN